MIVKISRWFASLIWGTEEITMTTVIWRRQDRWPYSWLKWIIEFFDPDHFEKYHE